MKNARYFRTDMADEWDVNVKSTGKHLKKTTVVVDNAMAQKLVKPVGTYITVQADAVVASNKPRYDDIVLALKEALCELGDMNDCLVVGLGNAYLTADALGNKVVKDIIVTRHIKQKHPLGVLSAITPSVFGVTGIESYDLIAGVVSRTKPKCIIAVDSLASATVDRLATAFQVSNAGITPGSGVGNSRTALDQASLGCPVYSIGVPLVVFVTTIIEELYGHTPQSTPQSIQDMIVTPKDIDLLVQACANIIAQAINLSVHKNLKINDLKNYL